MKIYPPSDNPLTGGYNENTHRAYDHAGLNLPDEIRAGMDGQVIEIVNLYNTNWTNNGVLTTKDYGNYIKIRHIDSTYELHAHLKKDSMLPLGSKITTGQIIARIGNTGNSTGPHVHSEYRDEQNRNIPVEFSKQLIVPTPIMDTNWKQITDYAKGKFLVNEAKDVIKYIEDLDAYRKAESKEKDKKQGQIEALEKDNVGLSEKFDIERDNHKAELEAKDKACDLKIKEIQAIEPTVNEVVTQIPKQAKNQWLNGLIQFLYTLDR